MQVATFWSPDSSSLPCTLVRYSFCWSTRRLGLNFFMKSALLWHFPQKFGMSLGAGLPTKPLPLFIALVGSSWVGSPPWQLEQERPLLKCISSLELVTGSSSSPSIWEWHSTQES